MAFLLTLSHPSSDRDSGSEVVRMRQLHGGVLLELCVAMRGVW